METARIMWLLEKRVILVQLAGEFTMPVAQQQALVLKQHIEQGEAPLYVIVDTSRVTTLPKNLREPLTIATANLKDSKVNQAVIVTSNAVFRFFGTLASKFVGFDFRPVTSLEEAINLLVRVDPTLKGLQTLDLSQYRVPTTS